jgi:hypothetical protein
VGDDLTTPTEIPYEHPLGDGEPKKATARRKSGGAKILLGKPLKIDLT